MQDSIEIVKKYFEMTKTSKRTLLSLFFTAFLTHAPYMFTALLWSLFIRYLLIRNINGITVAVIAYFGLKIMSKIFNALNLNIQKKVHNHKYRSLQNKLIAKLDDLDPNYFDSDKKSNILNTANIDVKQLSNFGNWLVNITIALFGFVISIIILYSVSIWYMLFAVTVNAIMILLLNNYNRKYEMIVKNSRHKTDSEIGLLSQILNGLSEIKIFNIQSKITDLYQSKNNDYTIEHNKQINNNIIRQVITPSISMTAEILIVIYYIYGFMNNNLTLDLILLLHAYFGNMFSNLSNLSDKLSELRVISVSIERYYDFVNEKDTLIKYGEYKTDRLDGNIAFKNVTFGYNENTIFHNLNFEIPSKKISALIGESGSGKSTIFNLLLRFYKPKNGSIEIDNINIFDFDLESYSHNLSIVKQDSFMFNMSIYENMALINPSRKRIIEVCKKVRLHDFIMKLPDGYDTVITEGATDLSGGQRQRLSIARTLLKDTGIILLDEITSALNKDLSNEIFDLLNELKKEHTILMITHKDEEVAKCDHVFEVKSGSLEKVR